jgi:hypothetical protein
MPLLAEVIVDGAAVQEQPAKTSPPRAAPPSAMPRARFFRRCMVFLLSACKCPARVDMDAVAASTVLPASFVITEHPQGGRCCHCTSWPTASLV